MAEQLFKFGVSKDKPKEQQISRFRRDDDDLEMSNETFNRIRKIIYDLSGIYYTDSKKYLLENRIARRLTANKMKSFEEYIRLLKSRDNREELDQLFEVITINETYFFRAFHQFEAFRDILVPELMEKKQMSSPTIRIWSAASSTGEEPYTLAIIILEYLKRKYPRTNFQILASDINSAVLDSARKGVFKQYSVRNVPEHILKKYFRQEGNKYIINDEVKKLVKFTKLNLYDSHAIRSISGCDVIFCANVLIYFDQSSKQKVVSNLYNALNKGGYLFIGYSESLHGVSRAFKLVHLPKAMAYKKE